MSQQLRKLSSEKAEAAADRTVRGYASVWDVVDREGDRVRKGAFAKAVQAVAAGAILPVLWRHDHEDLPVGRVTKLAEDDRGLYFEAQLSDTSSGRDLHTLVVDKIVRQVSVGGAVIKAETREDATDLVDLQLDEISLTALDAANPAASVRKLSMYQATDALSLVAGIKSGIERLVLILSSEDSYGQQASDATKAAIHDEAANLSAFVKQQFKALNTNGSAK